MTTAPPHPAPAPTPVRPADDSLLRHSLLEDAQALVTGTLLIALAVAMYRHAGLLSGGTSGLAFLGHYASGARFGVWFFLLNLPFYWLAWRRMGRAFTFKTFAAVGLLSLEVELLPQWIGFEHLAPLYASVMGGMLMGTGFLILFRHRASLGGVGILALVLQEERGWRAGHVQMAVDAVIVTAALFIVPWPQVLISIGGAVALNMVLAVNHRPGRYVAQ
ncbi:YitT family protein [Sphaerotilus microaerophilus]|uniref:Membrane protein n=1 Tax=Sphaerotilus microaerophilus TaxID=2914710 RepID=A0ABN6PDN9_9BURK|nr:YitT family protein [Sphaerotilus sp. FB-5]BDI03136.1 membrane protein [Sphaerotilus sp. FB-5]